MYVILIQQRITNFKLVALPNAFLLMVCWSARRQLFFSFLNVLLLWPYLHTVSMLYTA